MYKDLYILYVQDMKIQNGLNLKHSEFLNITIKQIGEIIIFYLCGI